MLTVCCTFALVMLGGTVTSNNAGLSVPDWPTTFGYNMYLVPFDMWIGRANIFWEHSHRLLGSVIGMLTIGVAAAWWFTQSGRTWLRWTAMAALVLVIIQGVMGGLRVTELSTALGVVHGVTAQVFLSLMVVLTAAVGRVWIHRRELREQIGADIAQRLHLARRPVLILLVVMFVQLVLGAAMRHNHAGLAIPDFPTAYGGLVPPFTQEGIHAGLDAMPYDEVPPYDFTPPQVIVHFAHRVWAVAVLVAAVWAAVSIGPAAQAVSAIGRPITGLAMGLILQVALGVGVIWSQRHPEIATAHQALGAALLATTTLLVTRVHLLSGSPAVAPSSGKVAPFAMSIQGAQA
jgi:cytochrome c oxidase assembly protein subunit 15